MKNPVAWPDETVPDLWLRKIDVARRYQVSVRTIDNWMADGKIPYIRVNRIIRFSPAACDEALKQLRR
jgi:predicted site-specific integrase-resolvase